MRQCLIIIKYTTRLVVTFQADDSKYEKKKTQNRKNFLHHENETKAIHTLTAIESDRAGGQDTVERTSQ